MATLADLYQDQLRRQITGQNARDFGGAAARRARAQAQGVGAGMAGIAPAAAARNAQQVAAQASINSDIEAARMGAAERAQGLQLAQQQLAAEQSRGDRFLGAGLSAAATGLGGLLQAFGGGGQPQAPTTVTRATMPAAAPAQAVAPVAAAGGAGAGLAALLGGGALPYGADTLPAPMPAQPAAQPMAPPASAVQPTAPMVPVQPTGDALSGESVNALEALTDEEENPLAGLFGMARGVAPGVASIAGGPLAGLATNVGLDALLGGLR